MTGSLVRLDQLETATEAMTVAESEEFRNHMLGALAHSATDEAWSRALEVAVQIREDIARRQAVS